ncbi:hypothetical protein BJ742DRAFT_888459 [Cladochytrium replicatum]|nr:hypothetical protein BJ742DRAFT_888459 [Cladochytrium replicatum]
MPPCCLERPEAHERFEPVLSKLRNFAQSHWANLAPAATAVSSLRAYAESHFGLVGFESMDSAVIMRKWIDPLAKNVGVETWPSDSHIIPDEAETIQWGSRECLRNPLYLAFHAQQEAGHLPVELGRKMITNGTRPAGYAHPNPGTGTLYCITVAPLVKIFAKQQTATTGTRSDVTLEVPKFAGWFALRDMERVPTKAISKVRLVRTETSSTPLFKRAASATATTTLARTKVLPVRNRNVQAIALEIHSRTQLCTNAAVAIKKTNFKMLGTTKGAAAWTRNAADVDTISLEWSINASAGATVSSRDLLLRPATRNVLTIRAQVPAPNSAVETLAPRRLLSQAADQISRFSIAGVQYGWQCFCGNAIRSNPALAPVQECMINECRNHDDYFGAGYRMLMYVSGTAATSVATISPTAGYRMLMSGRKIYRLIIGSLPSTGNWQNKLNANLQVYNTAHIICANGHWVDAITSKCTRETPALTLL